jgi:hypothetical protein
MGLFPNAAYLHHSGEYRTVRGDVPLKAGLEKNPGLKKNQPSGFFFGFLCFFGFFIYLPRRESF